MYVKSEFHSIESFNAYLMLSSNKVQEQGREYLLEFNTFGGRKHAATLNFKVTYAS